MSFLLVHVGWRTVTVADSLASMKERCSINDRGHKHANGHSVVEFFPKDVLSTSAVVEVPSHAVPIPLEPVAQSHFVHVSNSSLAFEQARMGLVQPAACVAGAPMDVVAASREVHADAGSVGPAAFLSRRRVPVWHVAGTIWKN